MKGSLPKAPITLDSRPFFVLSLGPPFSSHRNITEFITYGLKIRTPVKINTDKYLKRQPKWEDLSKKISQIIPGSNFEAKTRLIQSEADAYCTLAHKAYLEERKKDLAEAEALLKEQFRVMMNSPESAQGIICETHSAKPGPELNWIKNIGNVARTRGYHPIIIYPLANFELLKKRNSILSRKAGRVPCDKQVNDMTVTSFMSLGDLIDDITRGEGNYEEIIVLDHTELVATFARTPTRTEPAPVKPLSVHVQIHPMTPVQGSTGRRMQQQI